MHRAELQRGISLVGPHRDDMVVRINRRPARDSASQGQQRSAALTLKLAELELAQQQCGEYPLLLLDDVFSELDRRRRNQILNLVRGKAQTFITAADDRLPLPSGQRWLIDQGRIVR